MKKYYIHQDEQQQGPFSKEELIEKKITRDTMVWFEGVDNWVEATKVDELEDIFKSIPPPIQSKKPMVTHPPLVNDKIKEKIDITEVPKEKKRPLKLLIIIFACTLIAIIVYSVYSNQQAKQLEIERQLEEQKVKIQEQERIEAERLAEEEKQKRIANAAQRQIELDALKYDYDQAVINLGEAKIKLNEIQQFQLLRTIPEKQQQVKEQLETILAWEKEVERLQKEIDKY